VDLQRWLAGVYVARDDGEERPPREDSEDD
jgi:endogenous inhibitor of DNA gyrase (YacG/DUF329 family)